MALVQNSATQNRSDGVTSNSHSHTITAGANVVFAIVLLDYGSGGMAVTYGGTAMILIGSARDATFIYRLLNPASGAQTVAASWTTGRSSSVIAVDFSGAHATDPDGTPATATGSTTTPTVNVASVNAGDIVIGAESQESGVTTAVGAGQTSFDANNFPGKGSTETGTGTVTHSYTIASGVNWSIVAFSVLAAPSGGGPVWWF